MASKDCLPNRLQKKLVGFFTNEFFYSYNHKLPAWILLPLGTIFFVLQHHVVRDWEEIHLVIPLALYGFTGIGEGTIIVPGNLHLLNVLEELVSLLPAAYIPEAMTLEGKLYHALVLILAPPLLIAQRSREIRHSGTLANLIHSLVCRHREIGTCSGGAAQILEYSLSIVEIELTQTIGNPGMIVALELGLGSKIDISMKQFLQIVTRRSSTHQWFSIHAAIIGLQLSLLIYSWQL